MPFLATLAAAMLASADSGGGAIGRWSSPSGSITIAIAPCPTNAAQLCGTVVEASPRAIADTRRASGRELKGMMLVRGMKPVGPNRWRGTVEVPDRKHVGSGALRLLPNGRLEVKGCALGGLVCKAQRWKRAD